MLRLVEFGSPRAVHCCGLANRHVIPLASNDLRRIWPAVHSIGELDAMVRNGRNADGEKLRVFQELLNRDGVYARLYAINYGLASNGKQASGDGNVAVPEPVPGDND